MIAQAAVQTQESVVMHYSEPDKILAEIRDTQHNPTGRLTAWQIGYIDAEEMQPFAPEVYFANGRAQLRYAFGFSYRRPHCLIANDFIAAADAEAEEELLDHEYMVQEMRGL